MAIDYHLEFVSNLEPSEVLALLAEKLDFKWWEQSHLIGTGLTINSFNESRRVEFTQIFFEQAYGFRPTICVSFRLDKFADRDEGYRNMFRAVNLLLSHVSGDAVLMYNGEITVLQRIGGKLELSYKWNPTPPAELTLPYEMTTLASPLV